MYAPPFGRLKTKDKSELLKVIRSTKIKMGKLRRKMESPAYKEEVIVCPSNSTIYKCDREFLEMAIMEYTLLGGDYKESKKEVADRLFNERLKDVVKITFRKGGFDRREKTIVDLTEEKPIFLFGFFGDFTERYGEIEKEDFLAELESMHIGEWKKEYRCEDYGLVVLDGEEWELVFEYKDGKTRSYYGHEAYPYNFDELLSLLEG